MPEVFKCGAPNLFPDLGNILLEIYQQEALDNTLVKNFISKTAVQGFSVV